MFFPFKQLKHTPALYDLEYDEVWIPVPTKPGEIEPRETEPGIIEHKSTESLHSWWIPTSTPDAPVILYFHHNAANIGANVSQALQLHQLGYAVFLFDYRGFGQSQGDFPIESRLYEDAEAAWIYLTQTRQIPSERIVIYGHSVGGAIAIDLARRHPDAAALVVHNSFSSMRDMTKRFGLYWLLPMELLLRQRFESEQKMRSITMPVLVITGDQDIQIPVSMGIALYDAAAGSKDLIVVEGGGHDNHLAALYQQQMQQFLNNAIAPIPPR